MSKQSRMDAVCTDVILNGQHILRNIRIRKSRTIAGNFIHFRVLTILIPTTASIILAQLGDFERLTLMRPSIPAL